MAVPDKGFCQLHAEGTAGNADQIKDCGPFFSGQHNGFSTGICNISQADSKSRGHGSDPGYLPGMLCHNGAGAQSKNGIGAVIDNNGVCNAVDQWFCLKYPGSGQGKIRGQTG